MSSTARVLIVDDETSILDTLRILLKREGFEVHTAVGGQKGLEALPEIQPDFVLTDIRMPGVGGIEILEAAREMDPTLPVILMTAQASLQSAIQAVHIRPRRPAWQKMRPIRSVLEGDSGIIVSNVHVFVTSFQSS